MRAYIDGDICIYMYVQKTEIIVGKLFIFTNY